ncbi:MAG TPA: AMP-binding protein, partial [Solirubrobacterales bacterium]|nr:AMP-binding protein [Solirubrobacterales bacterium]
MTTSQSGQEPRAGADSPTSEPSAAAIERARLTGYRRWLEAERGLSFAGYADLHRWSTTELEDFWASIWEFFDLHGDGDPTTVLGRREMPGARWFPDVSLNYTEHIFAGRDDDEVAILHASELRELSALSWRELRNQVASVAAGLKELGVVPGDRVVAYLPNLVEATVAFLASASVGAVWSSCSPDFGAASVVDRFAQIGPKVLFAVDGYRYGGKDFGRLETVAELQRALPTLERTVLLPYLDRSPDLGALARTTGWDQFTAAHAGAELTFERVPFDHPLWVL